MTYTQAKLFILAYLRAGAIRRMLFNRKKIRIAMRVLLEFPAIVPVDQIDAAQINTEI